jgi:hypothetical protein
MYVREYIEEFYKVNIREGYVKDTPEKFVRYINRLRLDIQDEIIFLCPKKMKDAYLFYLKAKEKLAKRQS